MAAGAGEGGPEGTWGGGGSALYLDLRGGGYLAIRVLSEVNMPHVGFTTDE